MAVADGARQAATKVDCSAAVAEAPCCWAAAKCACRIEVAWPARGSADDRPMINETKSAMAAFGSLLDQVVTPATCLLAATSMTCVATDAQMFSVPARKNSVGALGRTGMVAPRPYPSEGSPDTISGTVWVSCFLVGAFSAQTSASPSRASSAAHRWSRRATAMTGPAAVVVVGAALVMSGDANSSVTSAFHESPLLWNSETRRWNSGSSVRQAAEPAYVQSFCTQAAGSRGWLASAVPRSARLLIGCVTP